MKRSQKVYISAYKIWSKMYKTEVEMYKRINQVTKLYKKKTSNDAERYENRKNNKEI